MIAAPVREAADAEAAFIRAEEEIHRAIDAVARLGLPGSSGAAKAAWEAIRHLNLSYRAVAEELADLACDDGGAWQREATREMDRMEIER